MSEIDKTSLAWIGFSALWRSLGVSEKEIVYRWTSIATPQNVTASWEAVAEAIATEAIKRYQILGGESVDVAPKPRYSGFLEATRDLSR